MAVPAATAAHWPDALLSRIEDCSLNASAPPQQRWLDGWLVRLSPGKAKRARSIQAVADGRLPLDERLDSCAAAYREAGLPMLIRITPFSRPAGLDQALADRGYHRFDETHVMAAEIEAVHADPLAPGVLLVPVDHAEFAEQVGTLRGSPARQRQSQADRLAMAPVRYQGWLLRRRHDSTVVACGQIACEAEQAGLYDVFTAPHARGQGLARQLCAALLAKAREQGARFAYLQVDDANLAARAVYRRLGLADAYAYHYRAVDNAAH